MSLRSIILVTLGFFLAQPPAFAAPRQDIDAILNAVKSFLMKEGNEGRQGMLDLQINAVDLRVSLPRCERLEPFRPVDSARWGDTTIGVRCAGNADWVLLLPVHLELTSIYLAATHPLESGHIMTRDDFVIMEGDVGNLPSNILTSPSQAIGTVVLAGIAGNEVLDQNKTDSASTPTGNQIFKTIARGHPLIASAFAGK